MRQQTVQCCGTRFVGDFRELLADDPGAPSIHDAAGLEPRPHETQVAAYPRAGSILAASPSTTCDVLGGDGTAIGALTLQTDGTWFWYSDLPYYIETYHLALDDRFLTHAANSNWQPPQLGLSQLLALEEQLTSSRPAHPSDQDAETRPSSDL